MAVLPSLHSESESATGNSRSRVKYPLPVLKPLLLSARPSTQSLVQDKLTGSTECGMWQPGMLNNVDALNYLRPSNQLVLLLQKGSDFPVYPPELAECIEEKTWYKRMNDLEKALKRYWSWVEKALFAFAFVASVTVPWPVISVISRHVQAGDDYIYEDEPSSIFRSTPSTTPTTAPSSRDVSPTETISSMARTATEVAARFVRRQANRVNETLLEGDDDFFTPEYDDEGELWPGYQSWTDGYSSDVRWAAIGILIGVVVAVWLPWFIITMKNNRRLKDLMNAWNDEDSALGPMRALTWSLDKAPAISNAKFLVIGLPACFHQSSVFHANAYPPMYGFSRQQGLAPGGELPDYHEEGRRFGSNEKEDWYAPPQALDSQQVRIASEEAAGPVVVEPFQDGKDVRSSALTEGSVRQDATRGEPSTPMVGHSDGEVIDEGIARPKRSSSRSSHASGKVH